MTIFQGFVAAPGAPWPHPRVWRNSTKAHVIEVTNLDFTYNLDTCDIIRAAIQRYKTIFKLYSRYSAKAGIRNVRIDVRSGTCEKYPHGNMDESCKAIM